MSNKQLPIMPPDMSFLRRGGYRVHSISSHKPPKIKKSTTPNSRAVSPSTFHNFLPKAQEQCNSFFAKQFREFQYRTTLLPPPLREEQDKEDGPTQSDSQLAPQPTPLQNQQDRTDRRMTSGVNVYEAFRLKLKAAFQKFSPTCPPQQLSRQHSQLSSPHLHTTANPLGLTLSQHLQQSQPQESQICISLPINSRETDQDKNSDRQALPQSIIDRKQIVHDTRLLCQIKKVSILTKREKARLQSEIFRLNYLSKAYSHCTDLGNQIQNKKKAFEQYLQLLQLQEQGVTEGDHEQSKKAYLRIIKSKINQPSIDQLSPHTQYHLKEAITHKQIHLQSTSQAEMGMDSDFLTVKKVMTRRLAQALSPSQDKIQLLQLKITPKADFYRKQTKKSSSSSKRPAPPKAKRRKIKERTFINRNSEFDQILLKELPSRNPVVKHQFNSQDHNQILFSKELKKNCLYYLSDILEFSQKEQTFNTHLKPKYGAYIDDCIKSTRHCRAIIPPSDSAVKKIKLKRNFEYTNKKILLLDLDETLVHSQGLNEPPNKNLFPFSFDFQKTTRHYSVRNYAQDFIKNLSQKYYLVLFTSAVEGYADSIMEHLDPKEAYIQHRLYRSHCYLHGETFPYIKDLRILNRDLSQVIIVDNSLYAYWFQIENGVPIVPFMGEQDCELKKLQKYLLKLQKVDDIREVNRRTFHMHLYQELDSPTDIVQQYCHLMNDTLNGKQ